MSKEEIQIAQTPALQQIRLMVSKVLIGQQDIVEKPTYRYFNKRSYFIGGSIWSSENPSDKNTIQSI